MSSNILHITGEEFKSAVLESDMPVIIDFFSDDCAPCDVLAPIYEKMAEKYAGHIKFVKIHRQENREFALSLGVSGSPTVLFFKDGKEVGARLSGFMNKPQVRKAIEDILGDVLPKEVIKCVDCDVLILGAGAAGLAAAIYTSRAKLATVVVDISVPGGQAASTYHIENYPGTPGMVRGRDLIANMREQALSFGARIDDLKEIFDIRLTEKTKYVLTEDTEYHARAVIVAAGANPRALPAVNADEYKGRGVHYCATCDGSMYEGRKVVVIGGGNAAVDEALFLTRYASHVTIIHRSAFRAAKSTQDTAFDHEKIDVVYNSKVTKVNGLDYSLESVEVENLKTGEVSEVKTDGAFVYIGTEPASAPFAGQLELDADGYIVAGEDTKTTLDGVFAAGDIRTKLVRQVVTAASAGAVAGIMAEKYVGGC
jgi:thioredoxin reductase (NADPH)